MSYMPMVVENTGSGERGYDLPSRLLKDRIVMLNGQVDDASANAIVMQFLFLSAEDPEADIFFYINSPGGVVTAGMSIYDIMNAIPNDIVTICMGQAASMGSFLLSAGTTDKRYALPHSRIMIHQPLGGAQGQATDMEIHVNEIIRMKKELTTIIANNSNGKTSYDDFVGLMERDNFLSPSESVELGLIDKVITTLTDI